MASTRRLIVNADDLGFTRDVNTGILEAHQRGILTAATLMANGAAFDHAVALARENPSLDVGCHLVLVGGPEQPPTVRHLAVRVLASRSREWIEQELSAQVEKMLRAGLDPSHLDTHKHTHLLPPVLKAVCRVARRFGIPWVRRPFDLPLTGSAPLATRGVNAAVGLLRRPFSSALARHQCRTTDHFAGFQWTGAFGAAELVRLIHSLPEGLTELMCHPGHCTDELRRARTRLKESRAAELRALVAPQVRQALREAGVELTNYRQ